MFLVFFPLVLLCAEAVHFESGAHMQMFDGWLDTCRPDQRRTRSGDQANRLERSEPGCPRRISQRGWCPSTIDSQAHCCIFWALDRSNRILWRLICHNLRLLLLLPGLGWQPVPVLFLVVSKDTFVKSNSLYIVMEYADGGDLASLIRKHKDEEQPLTETHAMTIFSQCLLALQYIHSKRILHRR